MLMHSKRTIWSDTIERQLKPFENRTHSKDEVLYTLREAPQAIYVEIKNNEIVGVGKANKRVDRARIHGFLGLIADCLSQHEVADLICVVNVCDHPIAPLYPPTTFVPVFTFCKQVGDEALLIPFSRIGRDDVGLQYGNDGMFGWTWMRSWEYLSKEIWDLAPQFPIEQKNPACLFAGHNCSWDKSRLRFAWLAQRYPEILKCRITYLCGEPTEPEIKIVEPCMGEPIKMRDYGSYKYLMHLDGNTSSERLRCLLAFNSVVIKTSSPWEEFYFPLLVPNQHYVEVDAELNNLIPAMAELENDPKRYKEISQEGQNFTRTALSYQSVLAYMAELLNGYAALRRW